MNYTIAALLILCLGALVFGTSTTHKARPSNGVVPPQVSSNSGERYTDWVTNSVDLQVATEEAGKLEMSSAGFHPFVADPMNDLRRWYLPFDITGDQSPNTWGYVVAVDIDRDTVLQATIKMESVMISESEQGGYDVMAQFGSAVQPHCKNRQIARTSAESTGQIPRDKGVAFVWQNRITMGFTYGELADALSANPATFIRLARGLPFEDAQLLVSALVQ